MMANFVEGASSVGGITGIGALLLAITTWIKMRPRMRQIELEGDTSLRSDLLARVSALEAEVVSLRKSLDREREKHATELADIQHELANETQSLDAFILLAEANPERVLEQLPKIKEMRARHRERVALKRGVREGAAIASAEGAGE